jgi:hypothetical protein
VTTGADEDPPMTCMCHMRDDLLDLLFELAIENLYYKKRFETNTSLSSRITLIPFYFFYWMSTCCSSVSRSPGTSVTWSELIKRLGWRWKSYISVPNPNFPFWSKLSVNPILWFHAFICRKTKTVRNTEIWQFFLIFGNYGVLKPLNVNAGGKENTDNRSDPFHMWFYQ